MAVETASTIRDLNPSWPDGSETFTQGDDHLRLIKAVLKTIFPGASGLGFSTPITATEAEINSLHGVTGNIADLLAAATFPAGTTLIFYQAAPPPGWTLVSVPTSYMLTVGAAAGGSSGGTHNPILMDVVPTHSHTAAGSATGAAGGHTHATSPVVAAFNPFGTGNIYGGAGNIDMAAITVDTVPDHTHSLGTITVADNAGTNWQPRYLGTILCQKS